MIRYCPHVAGMNSERKVLDKINKVHFGSTPMSYHRPGVYFDSCLFILSSYNDENKYITQIVHSEGRIFSSKLKAHCEMLFKTDI